MSEQTPPKGGLLRFLAVACSLISAMSAALFVAAGPHLSIDIAAGAVSALVGAWYGWTWDQPHEGMSVPWSATVSVAGVATTATILYASPHLQSAATGSVVLTAATAATVYTVALALVSALAMMPAFALRKATA